MCVSASSSYFSSSPSLQKWFVPTLTFGVPANACDTYTHSQNTNALIRESGHLHVTPTRAFRSPSYQKVTFLFFFSFVPVGCSCIFSPLPATPWRIFFLFFLLSFHMSPFCVCAPRRIRFVGWMEKKNRAEIHRAPPPTAASSNTRKKKE